MQARDKIDIRSYELIHNRVINLRNIDIVYLPIIEDVLIRRTYLYGLSFEEVQHDVEMLEKWVTRIDLEMFPEEDSRFVGFFSSIERRISFNLQRFHTYILNRKFGSIYDTIAHEITHALCRDDDGYDILATKRTESGKTSVNKYSSNVYNSSLLELIVSELANRMSYKRGNDSIESSYSSKAKSYTSSSEILELIEAAYGVKEKDLLDHAVRGRMEMAEFLSGKSGESIDGTIDLLDLLEVKYDVLHKILYKRKNFPNMTPTDRYLTFMENTIELYKICLNIMDCRIRNTKVSSILEAQQLCEDLEFDYNRINYLIESFLGKFKSNEIEGTELSGDLQTDILPRLAEKKFLLARKIARMHAVQKIGMGEKSESEILEDFNEVRESLPSSIEFPAFEAIDINSYSFPLTEEIIERHRDEEIQWDNYEMIEYMSGALRDKIIDRVEVNEAIEKGNIFRTMLDGIKVIFSIDKLIEYFAARRYFKRYKRLPQPKDTLALPGGNEGTKSRDSFASEIRVESPEQIVPKPDEPQNEEKTSMIDEEER